MAVLLRCAGWNLFRSLAAMKKRGIGVFAAFSAASASSGLLVRSLKLWIKASDGLWPDKAASGCQTSMLTAA